MPQAGFDPPEQSHASYEANALPQSITAGLNYFLIIHRLETMMKQMEIFDRKNSRKSSRINPKSSTVNEHRLAGKYAHLFELDV